METARATSEGLRRFERVVVVSERRGREYFGHLGTIIWVDEGSPGRQIGPSYVVHLSHPDRYPSFSARNLRTMHEIDPAGEDPHRGRRFEISFDTILWDGDYGTIEGSFRVPGTFWQVFIFLKGDVSELRHAIGLWRSGIHGVEFLMPKSAILDRGFVIGAMSEVFGTRDWVEVDGPDSLILK